MRFLSSRILIACCATFLPSAPQASAEVDFPIQIAATENSLPPLSILEYVCGAPEVIAAAAKDAGLTVVMGAGRGFYFVRAEDGTEFLVKLNLAVPEWMQRSEDSSTTYWGFVQGAAYDQVEGGTQVAKYEPIVQRVVEAWLPRMEAALSELAAEPVQRKLERAKLSLDLNARQLSETKHRIEDTQAQLSQSNSTGSLPISTIEALYSESITQLKQFEVELIGLHARNDALEERIASVVKETDEQMRMNNAIADDLSEKLKLLAKDEELLRKKVAAGEARQSEIDAIDFQVTATLNDLNNARRSANGGDVDTLLSKLRASLTDTAIQIAESEAKRRFVLDQAKEREVVLRESQRAQPMRVKLAMLQRQLDTLETERFELSRAAALAEVESRPVHVRKLVPEPAQDEKADTSP